MPRSSHDAENQCDVGMQLSTPRQVARLCYSWPLSPGRGIHIFAFSCPNPVPHHICSVPLYLALPGASIRHQVRGTQPGWMAGSLPACLPEHRIEHRLDLTCLAHDPTHMQLRVCSPARLSGRSVWVDVVIIGMAQPDLASFVEERRRQTTTATTRTKATTATTATATTTSTSTSQTTTTSTNRLHTHYCLVLPAPESSTLESSVLLRAFLTPLLRWRALPRPL
jgi:hypothetical protein